MLNKKRAIQPVVRKVSFAEAEEMDDKYWAEQSFEYRLKSLFELRAITFGNQLKNKGRIEKVVIKRMLHDEKV